MSRFTELHRTSRPKAVVMAVAAVALAIIARYALDPVLGDRVPYITLYPAVLITAVFGGGVAGTLTLLFGAVAAAAFPVFFHGALPGAPAAAVAFGIYLLCGGIAVGAASSLRATIGRLQLAQEKLLASLDASGAGTWRWDVRTDTLEWDPALVRLFGLDPDEAPRTQADFSQLVHEDDRATIDKVIAEALATGRPTEFEFRFLGPDGNLRWMYVRSRMIRDPGGQPDAMVGACLEVTDRKRAQQRQTLLVQELNHRVKNTLAVVQSLAMHTRRGSRTLDEFQEAFEARLLALSATHNILTRELWESASLIELIAAEMMPFGGLAGGRVHASGPPVRLKPQQALGFGLALHELATNAAKYGALSRPEGRLVIAWRTVRKPDGQTWLALDWEERGGPPVTPPKRLGFGSKLMERSIRSELGGELDRNFDPAGLTCTIRFPLETGPEEGRVLPP
nr:HWE histidine kinase domain-containing protein [Microvirga puerhi]